MRLNKHDPEIVRPKKFVQQDKNTNQVVDTPNLLQKRSIYGW